MENYDLPDERKFIVQVRICFYFNSLGIKHNHLYDIKKSRVWLYLKHAAIKHPTPTSPHQGQGVVSILQLLIPQTKSNFPSQNLFS